MTFKLEIQTPATALPDDIATVLHRIADRIVVDGLAKGVHRHSTRVGRGVLIGATYEDVAAPKEREPEMAIMVRFKVDHELAGQLVDAWLHETPVTVVVNDEPNPVTLTYVREQ